MPWADPTYATSTPGNVRVPNTARTSQLPPVSVTSRVSSSVNPVAPPPARSATPNLEGGTYVSATAPPSGAVIVDGAGGVSGAVGVAGSVSGAVCSDGSAGAPSEGCGVTFSAGFGSQAPMAAILISSGARPRGSPRSPRL